MASVLRCLPEPWIRWLYQEARARLHSAPALVVVRGVDATARAARWMALRARFDVASAAGGGGITVDDDDITDPLAALLFVGWIVNCIPGDPVDRAQVIQTLQHLLALDADAVAEYAAATGGAWACSMDRPSVVDFYMYAVLHDHPDFASRAEELLT